MKASNLPRVLLVFLIGACGSTNSPPRSAPNRYPTVDEVFGSPKIARSQATTNDSALTARPSDEARELTPQELYRLRFLPGCAILPKPVERTDGAEPTDRKPPETQGTVQRAKVKEVVASYTDEVRACYNAALAAWPLLEGRAVLQFVITPEGTIGRIGVDPETTVEPAVACCIAATVRTWKFPRPERGGVEMIKTSWVLLKSDRERPN